jgi:hypothetical protein
MISQRVAVFLSSKRVTARTFYSKFPRVSHSIEPNARLAENHQPRTISTTAQPVQPLMPQIASSRN